MTLFDRAFVANPLIAILRGLEPSRALDVAGILVGAGFRIIEVPMNSPNPLTSIERIASKFGDSVVVGAGTVLTENEVVAVHGRWADHRSAQYELERCCAGKCFGYEMVPRCSYSDGSICRVRLGGSGPEDIPGGTGLAKGNFSHARCPT